LFFLGGAGDPKALPKGRVPINMEDLRVLASRVDQQILDFEKEIGPKIEKIFQFESDIVKGEFEKDFASFEGEDPKLKALLLKHKKVFDELHPQKKVKLWSKWTFN